MRSSQRHARWTGAWRTVATLLVVALAPCIAIGARVANASTNASASPRVLFRDDFTGTKVNASKWNSSWFGSGTSPSNPVNGSEDDCYSPKQAMVKNGYLVLAATQQRCLGHAYTSGLVNTNGKFSFTTGVLKARVWLPGKGSTIDWPGIWTNGQRWPNDGEIDVLEGLGGHDCWHVHTTRGTVGGCGSITGGWHIVELDRTKTSLTILYDGKRVGTASTSAFAAARHYLVLNLAVSSSISPPEKPAFMLVDWIQVTQ